MNSTVSPAEKLIALLEGVRQTRPGSWTAKCPAHADHSPSLHITETQDGTLLLHDFAGCHAADVVGAVGLTLADLFPTGSTEHRPGQRRRFRVPASDLNVFVSREATVAALIAADVCDGKTITEEQWKRLALAAARLGRCADEARP